MQNSQRFLDAFNDIEAHLKNLINADEYLSFKELVDKASHKNSIVRHQFFTLRMCSDLRNAIVHQRRYNGRPIAEPCNEVVIEIEEIRNRILSPPSVEKFLCDVESKEASQSVVDTLLVMSEKSFSQVPIVDDGKIIGVMSTNTIARWLGNEIENDIFSLQETENRQVLKCTETTENYTFLSRKKTIADALKRFENAARQGKDLDAIIISETGSPSEHPIGIITRSDIPSLLRGLGIDHV